MRFPEVGAQAEGMAIGDGGAAQVSLIAMRDSHVEVDVGVGEGAGGFARERFVEGVQGGIVVASGIECESEVAVGLGVGGIHAEGGARFGEGLVGIFGPVEQVRKLAVRFGETGHQARRFRECVERFVEPVLPAQNGSEDKLQQRVIRPKHSAAKHRPHRRGAGCESCLRLRRISCREPERQSGPPDWSRRRRRWRLIFGLRFDPNSLASEALNQALHQPQPFAGRECIASWRGRRGSGQSSSIRSPIYPPIRSAFGPAARIRALEMPPASHRKMASEAGAGGACSACKEPAASRSRSHLRTQRFTKPSSVLAVFDERESPYGQNSPPALSPIGHGSNYEGHGPARQEGSRQGGESARLPGIAWVTLHSGCAVRHSGRHVRFGGFMFEGLFQPMHLLVIFAIALLVFGPKKLPELGKGLGEGIRALKNGMKDHDAKPEIKAETKPATPENNPENKA